MSRNLNNQDYVKKAKEKVISILRDIKFAYDRELRYRLESNFAHDVVGKAISELTKEQKIFHYGLPGRKRKDREMRPGPFLVLKELWEEAKKLGIKEEFVKDMKIKREISVLVGDAIMEASRHAEEAWWRAFKRLSEDNNWRIFPANEKDVGSSVPQKLLQEHSDLLRGMITEILGVEYSKRIVEEGRQFKADFDFVLFTNDLIYAIEIKNRLSYPPDLYDKLLAISELGLTPLIVARWLSPSQIKTMPPEGDEKACWISLIYKSLIFPKTYQELAEKAKNLLGIDILVLDEIEDRWFRFRFKRIDEKIRSNLSAIKNFQRRLLKTAGEDRYFRRTLGSRK